MHAVLVAGRKGSEKCSRFTGTGYVLSSHLLHALSQQLGGPFIEHEAVHQAQLDPEQEDHKSSQEVLIAIEFHRQISLGI